jgi:hypothetical protein
LPLIFSYIFSHPFLIIILESWGFFYFPFISKALGGGFKLYNFLFLWESCGKKNQFQKEKNNQNNLPQLKLARGKGFNNFFFHSFQGCLMRK